jgi:hypothetical protein
LVLFLSFLLSALPAYLLLRLDVHALYTEH